VGEADAKRRGRGGFIKAFFIIKALFFETPPLIRPTGTFSHRGRREIVVAFIGKKKC